MANEKTSNVVVEKSLSNNNIQFSYEQKKTLFSFLKNMQIDIITIIILALSFTGIVIIYFFDANITKKHTDMTIQYKALKDSYWILTNGVDVIKNMKTIDVKWERFLKIFELMNSLELDYYIKYDQVKDVYYSDLSNIDINILQDFILKGIKEKIIDEVTKKDLTITEPWKWSIKIIFLQR